jgi:hypothetical protein
LDEEYGEMLQINYIDTAESENLKLTFWSYYVPVIYIIDTDGRAYHINSIHFIDEFKEFQEELKSQSYRELSNLQFAAPELI